ncbi:MAG: hypothetical protein SFU86_11475 [Pirellulaceae bacterium]|nr:hypothetical protein [Pirellulaceae bacterium]
MSNRRLLRDNLIRAWHATITRAYAGQFINSERGLQVHFCIELLKEFRRRRVSRRLFIEPTLQFVDKVMRTPDLLICNTKQIIGVVEFKYCPRARPKTGKDLKTLARIRDTTGVISIQNERYLGEGKLRQYSVAEDAVFCWAGVYRSDEPIALDLPGLLRLDALTACNAPPAVLPCPKSRK